ncbi:CHRD domain-containing protein [Streptomyces sp. JJ36]|uniref:CHRD domain-containing protein n=1 Tax=Streptomyces sp. JJ36 TaxID=2736645 RepID=UPI001F35B480|nr:CHRD domain-containing protein [Streptomyces sp. JJ36]MCF6522710.1 CHRD domain-containing protein [Streptomyces sp. JJ36]
MRAISLAAAAALAASAVLTSVAGPAVAGGDTGGGRHHDTVKGRAFLDGAQEVPEEGDPDGRGRFRYVIKGDLLCYTLRVRRIETPTAAHIHFGPRGEAGPVAVTLRTPRVGVKVSDCIRARHDQNPRNAARVLTFWELQGIKQDAFFFYVNVHNEEFPAGAIRGQLRRTR